MIFHIGVAAGLTTVGFIISEYLHRKLHFSNELARKNVHMLHAVAMIAMYFIAGYKVVIAFEISFLIVVTAARKYRWFESLRRVERRSWGEYCFIVGIGTVALLQPTKTIFLAAMLHLGFADALAAIIGMHFVKKPGHYTIFGHTKTVIGSLTFFMVSVTITGWVILASGAGFSQTAWPVIIYLPILATLLEIASPYGTDNLFVPLLVVGILGSLQFIY